MTKEEKSIALHDKGCNCAQAVLCAFLDKPEWSRIPGIALAAGFGGGIGRSGGTCGAVSGAVMVLGLHVGMSAPEDAAAKEATYAAAKELVQRFRAEHGSEMCPQLLKVDISTPEGLAAAREKKIFSTLCPGFITSAVRIVEGMIGA